DDRERGEVRIFTPASELPFAGHPSVGSAWLLEVDVLRVPAGDVPARREDELTWIAARPEWAPDFDYVQVGSPADVDGVDAPPSHMAYVWAWEDEAAGRVRARSFPVALGIEEDEATGAAAVKLGARLGRELEIRQGRGSLIQARPRADGMVEVGGRVVPDSRRE